MNLRLICLSCFSLGLFFSIASSSEEAKPNVLLIITDDQGYGDFSIHGNPHLQTPNIDNFARQSVRFERFYVNSFCAPTRAALLTGRWPLRTGCYGVTHNKEAIRPSEITIAEALKPGGYETGYFGKWHNGEQFPYTPQGQGFDEFFGFNNGHWNNYFDATLLRGSQPEKTKGYISDVITEEAIRFISKQKESPFFCYVSYNAPHSPYQVGDKYFDKFAAKGFDARVSGFFGMCENIDDNVGRLLNVLETQKLSQNTIVVFLTDNGGTAGVKIYNAGMRGGKVSVHEGGSRVPLFVRWPQAKWRPHVAKPLTSHIDILPTLVDLCQVNKPKGPKLDGISLRPLLENSTSKTWAKRTLFTHNPISETNKFPGAVRTERYRLVCKIKGPNGGSSAKENDKSRTPWELYDMQKDPGERKNIAKANPEVVTKLSRQYDNWFNDISQKKPMRLPLAIGYTEHNPVELHAPQAYPDKPIRFANGPGFANDWITNWISKDSKIVFDVDIAVEGEYELSMAYACTKKDAGSVVEIIVGNQELKKEIQAAPAPEISLPHRDEKSRTRYRNRKWGETSFGKLVLSKGRTQIIIQPLTMPGESVMDFKHLKLKRISDR